MKKTDSVAKAVASFSVRISEQENKRIWVSIVAITLIRITTMKTSAKGAKRQLSRDKARFLN